MNPNSLDNLKPITSSEQASELGRRPRNVKKKELREVARALGDSVCYVKRDVPLRNPINNEPLTYHEAMAFQLLMKAAKGDLRAIELYCKLTGQLQQIAIANFPTVTFLLGDQEQNKTIDTDAEEIP